MNEVKNTGRVKVYACGGLGVNIGQANEDLRNTKQPGMAMLDITYIDTAKSNIRRQIDSKYMYLFDAIDGSGKVRAENHEIIAASAADILQKHKPLDVNIVLSSASGGSGPVIAGSVVSLLLAKGENVIVIIVGSTNTTIEASNTIKTIKTYEHIAQLRKQPVAAVYFENDKDKSPRATVDNMIGHVIGSLAVLFSGENTEMDSRDLFNWLHFSQPGVTAYGPQLAYLELVNGTSQLPEDSQVISVATLATHTSGDSLDGMPDYQAVGYLPDGIDSKVTANAPLHFVLMDGQFNVVKARLDKLLKEVKERTESRVKPASIVSADDNPTATGLLL